MTCNCTHVSGPIHAGTQASRKLFATFCCVYMFFWGRPRQARYRSIHIPSNQQINSSRCAHRRVRIGDDKRERAPTSLYFHLSNSVIWPIRIFSLGVRTYVINISLNNQPMREKIGRTQFVGRKKKHWKMSHGISHGMCRGIHTHTISDFDLQ